MKKKIFKLLLMLNKQFPLMQILPRFITDPIRIHAINLIVKAYPDRRYLEKEILPRMAKAGFKKVLFVGCESYTSKYGQLFKNTNTEFWTCDIKPENKCWGEPGRHAIENVMTLENSFSLKSFDAVILSGVFGFGINHEPDMNSCLKSIKATLIDKGILILGWNKDLSIDPTTLKQIRQSFNHDAELQLPQRKYFTNSSHVFDMFKLIN